MSAKTVAAKYAQGRDRYARQVGERVALRSKIISVCYEIADGIVCYLRK
eukprot:SAG11_NODE_3851_length_2190_cov_5.705404_2_plen_49_part_00